MLDTYSHAMCAPPSCATESSPYSLNTLAYNFSARSTAAVEPARGAGPSSAPGTLSANSSRNSRRSDFADREYRAKSAPLTVSGRFVSAKT